MEFNRQLTIPSIRYISLFNGIFEVIRVIYIGVEKFFEKSCKNIWFIK